MLTPYATAPAASEVVWTITSPAIGVVESMKAAYARIHSFVCSIRHNVSATGINDFRPGSRRDRYSLEADGSPSQLLRKSIPAGN